MKNDGKLAPEKNIVLLSMLYMALFLASMTVGYKIVIFGKQLYCASILIFPLLFPLSDALAEIYGVSIAKSMIWYTIISEAVFVTLTNTAISLPSPQNWHHQEAYNFIVGGYIHILIANSTAMIVSFYLNVYFINKWRILLQGKHYYWRSLGATAIGEIIYTIITNAIAYVNVLPWNDIFNIILSDFSLKLIYSIIILYPGALLVTHIKSKYGISGYSKIFNPFKQELNEKVVDFSQYQKTRTSLVPSSDRSAK
jgi:uncharacterized integral membrane protein (TIGR00697 family)